MDGAAGTVLNAGKIHGDGVYGAINSTAGGLVTNMAGGLIAAAGPTYGVQLTGGAATVINAGTIERQQRWQ